MSINLLLLGLAIGSACSVLEWRLLSARVGAPPAPRPSLEVVAALFLLLGGTLAVAYLRRAVPLVGVQGGQWDHALVGYVIPQLLLLVTVVLCAHLRSRGLLVVDARGRVFATRQWPKATSFIALAVLVNGVACSGLAISQEMWRAHGLFGGLMAGIAVMLLRRS